MVPFRVTLIDDDKIFKLIFGKLLSSYPTRRIELSTFPDALQALDYFRQHGENAERLPQALFVDINMPFMTGWEMLEQLSAENFRFLHQIPVFILSSSTSAADFEQVSSFDFLDDYLTKPIGKTDLFEKLDEHIAKYANIQSK